MPLTDPTSKPAQKHRACDECRSRKLACSKEDAGCSRCQKESLVCVYSEQKPMGRPRKRKHREEEQVDAAQQQLQPAPFLEIQGPELADFNFGIFDGGFEDFNDEFLTNNDFFDDLGLHGQSVHFETFLPETESSEATKRYREMGLRNGNATVNDDGTGVIWHFGIDALPPRDCTSSLDLSSFGASNGRDSTTNSVTTPSTAPNDQGSFPSTMQENLYTPETKPIECSCLASLYLALASLQTLPAEITVAMCTIREASYTASAVLNCQECGNCPITHYKPPMKSMQNHMLLGTLLPVIADGYKRLLKMIDDRYESAVLSGTTLMLTPAAYGVKTILNQTSTPCAMNWEKEVEPVQWRAAVRAFLRADVYGYGHEETNVGLKSLIKEMETRQRRRHDEIDALRDVGLLPLVENRLCLGEKVEVDNRTCERILDVARLALEELVIA